MDSKPKSLNLPHEISFYRRAVNSLVVGAAGLVLSGYGRNHFGYFVRFTADVMNVVAYIIVRIVAYGLVAWTQAHFSALAGGVALAIMMIPTIARATEAMLLLVPIQVREAA